MADWRQRELYKEETARIHAPQSLIERTKAAVREEERRLLGEAVSGEASARAGRGLEASMQAGKGREVESVPALEVSARAGKRCGWRFVPRRWSYALTAAAALLILTSVSFTLRGLQSGKIGSAGGMSGAADADFAAQETAPAEGVAAGGLDSVAADESADAGGVESAPAEEVLSADGAAAGAGDPGEAVMEAADAAAEEMDFAMTDMAGAEAVRPESAKNGVAAGAESAKNGAAAGTGAAKNGAGEGTEEAQQELNAAAMEAASQEMKSATKRMDQAEAMADSAANDRVVSLEEKRNSVAQKKKPSGAGEASFTIEKVTKKPALFERADKKTCRRGTDVFLVVAESKQTWAAYVEEKNGAGYVIRGAGETLNAFLDMAQEKLQEER